ncbi:hypothetical protein [Nonomuraea sp. NPDC050202]|uniref:hypothetical protein n=1 Tax=Nonomuraea sp. NPDC050202 TaxID=3155035 RepID=UPI0033DF46CD
MDDHTTDTVGTLYGAFEPTNINLLNMLWAAHKLARANANPAISQYVTRDLRAAIIEVLDTEGHDASSAARLIEEAERTGSTQWVLAGLELAAGPQDEPGDGA